MLGLKSATLAARYCRCHDELRNSSLPVPDASVCSCRNAALAVHAEDSDCPPYPRNRLSTSPPRANSSNMSGAIADRIARTRRRVYLELDSLSGS
jgi:hypothetical protein